uniref:Isoaspartyl peptidase/L-asparaginase n=1 Tax=Glossina palpalis gambiensis TaxID=67801 RepID=A0A1B0AZX1_9MUSC
MTAYTLGYRYLLKRNLSMAGKLAIKPILLVHGGAGGISDTLAPRKVDGMKQALRVAVKHLLVTKDISKSSALDAVEAAVRIMECDESFNAGYGSCLNIAGKVEVEASIMDGSELRAGCVALLHDIIHPVSVARCIMHKTRHVFLAGEAAQKFAFNQGYEQLAENSLVTESAQMTWQKHQERHVRCSDMAFTRSEIDVGSIKKDPPEGSGTVGAVAIDIEGNIAAATSTGGITGKMLGRIGDSSLLGCGTYADNLVGGVSATGHGETIMRFNLAQKIMAKIHYECKTAQAATEEACKEMTKRLLGTGGAITIGSNGQLGVYWTTRRMAWAYVKNGEICYGVDHDKTFKEPL